MEYLYHKPYMPLNLQMFAEDAEGDGGGQGGSQVGQAGVPTATSLDEVLKNPALQAEFDRRIAKALTTGKANWEKEQNMTAEQLAEQKNQERQAELDRREAELNQRALRAQALESLGEKGLPRELADSLAFSDEKALTASLEKVEKAFRDSLEKAVNDRLKGTPPKDGGTPDAQAAAMRAALGLPSQSLAPGK